MLRIAVQAKGRLYEETMALLEEADIKIPSSKRTLLVQSPNFPVEVLFLRDDDIPQTVATGVADLGIVGPAGFGGPFHLELVGIVVERKVIYCFSRFVGQSDVIKPGEPAVAGGSEQKRCQSRAFRDFKRQFEFRPFPGPRQ